MILLGAGGSSLPPPSTLSSTALPSHQILCCAFNANGTVFVTGSSDTYARVYQITPVYTMLTLLHACEFEKCNPANLLPLSSFAFI